MSFYADKRHIRIREFRAHMKACLQETAAFSIGDNYSIKAVIVPMPPCRHLVAGELRSAFAHMKREFTRRMAALRNACN